MSAKLTIDPEAPEYQDPTTIGLPDMPRPGVSFADHSYPAFSRRQMIDYARAAIAALTPAEDDKAQSGMGG